MEEDEDFVTVVNTKRIKNLERIERNKAKRLEYEKYKLEQALLEQANDEPEEEEDSNKIQITLDADFEDLVNMRAQKDAQV